MMRIEKAHLSPNDFGCLLGYLSDEPGEREHPALVAAARKLDLACGDAKGLLPVAYAAFQYGYVSAQVDAAGQWRDSHKKKDWKAFKERKREAVDLFMRLKEVRSRQTDAETEAQVAKDYDCSPRTIRRWRKSLGK